MFKLPVFFRNIAFSKGLSTVSSESINALIAQKIIWERPGKKIEIFCENGDYTIKIGKWPNEPLYHLYKGENKIYEFERLPENWTVPKSKISSAPSSKNS